jgi:hypothetical protein
MRYETTLSSRNINAVVKELKKRKQELDKKMVREFFLDCCRQIIIYANDNIRGYPIGDNVLWDIMTNWEYVDSFTGNSIILRNKAEKAAYVEFGVGIVAENSPHPKAGEAGYDYNRPSLAKHLSSNTVGYGTRAFEDGTWIFYTNENDLDLPPSALEDRIIHNEQRASTRTDGEVTKSNRIVVRTTGTEPTMFLFNAVVKFINNEDAKRIWAEIKRRYWS